MSVLSLPRLYFKGEALWNPDTPNNYPAFYSGSSDGANLPPGVTYDTLKQYLMGINSPNAPMPRGGWNLYGDQGCNFVDYDDTAAKKTIIIGGTMPNGRYVNDDPILGKGVQIQGNIFNQEKPRQPCRLVDVDPYSGGWGSQIFFKSLVIGDDQTGITGTPEDGYHRVYAYWIGNRNFNVSNNLIIAGSVSVVFQTAIPFEKLTINNQQSSALLGELKKIKDEGKAKGLMIRFCVYRTLYYQNGNRNKISQQPRNAQQLSNLYLQGEVFDNPAYSLLVGSIGLWQEGELATAPAGRYLVANKTVIPENRLLDSQTNKYTVKPNPWKLKPMLAQLDQDRKTLSLDLIDTFPEWDSSALKANFGSVKVQVINNDSVTDIATLNYEQYNQQAYEAQAGIVDIQIQDKTLLNKIADGQLALSVHQDEGDVIALEEQLYTALTDDRGVYIEEDETKTITVQVLYKGNPAPAGTSIALAQYDTDLNVIKNSDSANINTAKPKTSLAGQLRVLRIGKKVDSIAAESPLTRPEELSSQRVGLSELVEPTGPVNIITGTIVEVREGGKATIKLSPNKPGCCTIAFLPFAGDGKRIPVIETQLDVEYSDFTTIRVMPFDNDLADPNITPNEKLTWDFMYEHIFQVYHLIYPKMSRIIPMNNRQLMEDALMQIRAVLGNDVKENGEVKNDYWESTMYMSVTRDLSLGKRNLLRRWCNLVERDMQPE